VEFYNNRDFHLNGELYGNTHRFLSTEGGHRRPISSYKPSPPPLDSSFHRDKIFPATENSQHLKPESETPQESSAIKKDGSHRQEISNDDVNDQASNSSINNETTTVMDEPAIENITKKPELEDSTKKHHTIHKYHPPSKEIKINGEETLILGVATDYVSPAHTTRRSESSEMATTSSTQIKATKSSKSDEKASKTEKIVLTPSKTKTFSTSTLNIETSSSVHVIESIPTKIVLRPTSATSADMNAGTSKSSIVNLEPSRAPDIDHTESMYSVSTPTDALPATYSTSSSTTKSIAHTTSSIFTKAPGMLKISISNTRDINVASLVR
jgi:hypothetical protein